MMQESGVPKMNKADRRGFLRAAGLAAAGAVAACAPSASPPAPAPPAGQAEGSAKAAWETEWDQLVAAAKREGRMTMAGLAGGSYRKMLDAFERAFPGITVELKTYSSVAQWVPVVQTERQGGVYVWDVVLGSPASLLAPLKPIGAFAPLRPLLIRPDILQDSQWSNGFDFGWVDSGKQLGYAIGEHVITSYVNTDQVKEGEIQKYQDLLNPKWKGKMVIQDVRSGQTFTILTSLRLNAGEEVVRRLVVDQEPTFFRETRQIVEGMVRGNHAVSVTSLPVENLQEFQAQGLGKNIKSVDIDGLSYVTFAYTLFAVDRPPNPNAAKLFVNWLMTKEGGVAMHAAGIATNSRRTDVPPAVPDAMLKPGRKYQYLGKEETAEETVKTRKFLEDLVGIKN